MATSLEIDIEGKTYPWDKDQISTAQIEQLAGWPAGTGVIQIDDDNNQRTLDANDLVNLKEGHSYAKRRRFRRGFMR